MTGYKQLCSELIDELEGWVAYGDEIDIANAHVLIDRARAALAESEPDGPTRGEAVAVYSEVMATHECQTLGEMAEHFARAVLARWGNRQEILDSSALKPISVSERLPGPEDCDAERRCWWAEPQIEDSHDATWNLCTQEDAEEFLTWGTKYGWLPAHALPQLSSPSHFFPHEPDRSPL